MSRKLLFVVNVDWFFISHRLPIALAAIKAGYQVHLACAVSDKIEFLREQGIIVHPLQLSRKGMNPLAELSTLMSLVTLLRKIQPDILHLVTIKPVLYGGIAARLARCHSVVASISGLGFIFMTQGFLAQVRKALVSVLYRLALKHPNIRVIFQNPDDREVILKLGAVKPYNTLLIRGSGVDLSQYAFSVEPEGVPIVILVARMLKDKGILEYVDAIRQLKQQGVQARFWLVGGADANPSSIPESQLREWSEQTLVEWLGYRTDIPNLLMQAQLVVLPSYREGLPKALIEAAAIGRAVVTTDVPGCRDAIEPGVTGVLVPVKDSVALAKAIENLLADHEMRQSMAKAGRLLAEREFSIDKVVSQHLQIYQYLSVNPV